MNQQTQPQQPDTCAHTKVLATDLDGTLLPLEGNGKNKADLHELAAELQTSGTKLAFATGRHLQSVQTAMQQYDLPIPDWIICDVGTSIYKKTDRGDFLLSTGFAEHLQSVTGGFSTQQLSRLLAQLTELRIQEDEKQTRFKLSYYTDSEQLSAVVAEIQAVLRTQSLPYSVVASVDPFTGDGLVDLLPRHASKAYALHWWSVEEGFESQQVVYAGDSGNDSAAFAAGYRSIIVDNAAPHVREEAQRAHAAAGWSGRIFAATEPATSGVLQGLRHFLNNNCADPFTPARRQQL